MTEHKTANFILLTILVLYLSVGTIISFLQGGIAPILLAQGLELSSMGWVFFIYLPLGLAFFWAPFIDRYRLFKKSHRSGWMVVWQCVAFIAITITTLLTPQTSNWPYLIFLGLVVSFSIATVDLALDAFTAEQVKDEQRIRAGSAKVGGFTLGSLLGGGLLVAGYPSFGWTKTLGIIALINLIAWFLCLGLNQIEKKQNSDQKSHNKQAGILQALKDKHIRIRLIYVSLFSCSLFFIFGFNRLLMINMGMSLEKMGGIFGTLMPIFNLAFCAIVPLMQKKINITTLFRLFTVLIICSAVVVSTGFMQKNINTVIIGSFGVSICNTAFFILLASLILGWAKEGTQTATNYALIYGISRLSAIILAVFLPSMIQSIGWFSFQISAILFFVLISYLILNLLNKQKLTAS